MTSGEATIITKLVAQVSELLGRFDEQEKYRKELRAKDEDRSLRQEAKTDDIRRDLAAVKEAIITMPEMVDTRVDEAICRHEKHDSVGIRRWFNVAIACILVAAFAVFGTLEFIDHEETAGYILIALSAISPFVVVLLNRITRR
jgi:hypothetical protein